MTSGKKKVKYFEKNLTSATFPIKNHTLTALELNPGLCKYLLKLLHGKQIINGTVKLEFVVLLKKFVTSNCWL
jgi:hypothetical protein